MSKSNLVTKKEVLKLLSAQLRKPNLPPLAFSKLTMIYARLVGWPTRNNAGKPVPNKQDKLNQQLIELERQRKSERN